MMHPYRKQQLRNYSITRLAIRILMMTTATIKIVARRRIVVIINKKNLIKIAI